MATIKSIEENAKAYTELINRLEDVKDAIKKQNYGIAMDILYKPYPEFHITTPASLKESEDERIRKWLINYFREVCDNVAEKEKNAVLAWLEKQGEKDEEILILKDQIESLQAAIKAVKETHKIELEKQGKNNMGISEATKQKLEDNLHKALEKETPESWNEFLEKQGENKPAEWHREDEQNLNACLGYIPDEYLRRWLTDIIHVKYDKPTDKVEPKFHEGEWLCENEPNNYARFMQILEIVNVQGKDRYRISRDIHKDEDVVEFNFIEKYYHKFDIKDAKDGDVLVTDNGLVFIYNEYLEEHQWPFAYGGINIYGRFGICNGLLPFTHQKVVPATKEQRDTLLKTMADAGYTFDFEKKELKKIEQNPAWSEEDKNFMSNTLSNLTELKDRYGEGYGNVGKCIDWLKSLRPQNRWKPSDEQMITLRHVISGCSYDIEPLVELETKLKEL